MKLTKNLTTETAGTITEMKNAFGINETKVNKPYTMELHDSIKVKEANELYYKMVDQMLLDCDKSKALRESNEAAFVSIMSGKTSTVELF